MRSRPCTVILAVAAGMIAATLIVSGCGQTNAGTTSASTTSGDSGVTDAQLEALRSTPASEPMSGPTVPGIFTQADAEQISGLKNIKIVAQAGPS